MRLIEAIHHPDAIRAIITFKNGETSVPIEELRRMFELPTISDPPTNIATADIERLKNPEFRGYYGGNE